MAQMTTDTKATPTEITLTYRNYRGEVSQRTIFPMSIWFGTTEWHPEPGWLLSGIDLEKEERRDFALADCQFTNLSGPSDAVAQLVEANERYVVWSHEHAAWWRPNSAGYCNDVRAAGVYSRAEAISISHKFRDHWCEGTRPNELAVRVTDLPEWAQDALAAMEANDDH